MTRLEGELLAAHLDDLTAVFRRSAGGLALSLEINRARRRDTSFVLAFVDVDGMKLVNDTKGHAAGDDVLRCLATLMRANLRSFDPIVRNGRDEFVCGMGGIDMWSAHARFRYIDAELKRLAGVGITVGLASLGEGETLDAPEARADAELLQAKARRLGPVSPGSAEAARSLQVAESRRGSPTRDF